MPAMELTEIVAWALIAAGLCYHAARSLGVSAAAISAVLAAIATKEFFLSGV